MLSFTIYYQNVRGLRTKTETCYINSMNLAHDFICLTETNLNDSIFDTEILCDNYVIFRRDRSSSDCEKSDGGGVLVAVRKDIPVTPMPMLATGAEDLWLSVRCENTRVLVCCVYLPPNDPAPFSVFLHKLQDVRDHFPDTSILVVGDFNIPCVSWTVSSGCGLIPVGDLDARAKEFLLMISYCDFFQYNNIVNCNGRTLDLILCNSDLINSVFSCDDPLVNLDAHHPAVEFIFCLSRTSCLRSCHQIGWRFDRADYDGLKSALSAVDWCSVLNNLNVDQCVMAFYSVLNRCMGDFIPRSSTHSGHFPHWYSQSTIKAIKEKLKFHKKWKKWGYSDDFLSFKLLRKRTKALIASDYSSYLKRIQDFLTDSPSHLWSFVKSKKRGGACIPAEMEYAGNVADNGQQICELFSEYFSSVYIDGKLDNRHFSDTLVGETCPWFSQQDVASLLGRVNPKLGPGPDGLPGKLIVRCAEELAAPLFHIFSHSVKLSIFPTEWKKAHIIPIFKSGKKHLVNNYRPISLLSIISKVFEKLIYNKLYLNLQPQLIHQQHGFLRGRSVETNLVEFVNYIQRSMNDGLQVDTIYTDFSKAFDKIHHRILLEKLAKFNLSNGLISWIASYISNRRQAVKVDSFVSNFKSVTSGVPQGSHLGPILFLVYINDINECFRHSNFLLYADDCKIFSGIGSMSDCLTVQQDLVRLEEYCLKNYLFLNYDKCYSIIFSRKRYHINFDYHLGTHPVNVTSQIRDLGVALDSKLLFCGHVDMVMSEASKRLGFIIRVSRHFTNIQTIMSLYTAFVGSILNFASVVWNPSYAVYIDRIESLQKKFVRFLAHKFNLPYCSYAQRCLVFGITSLRSQRDVADMMFLYRLVRGLIDSIELVREIRFNAPSYVTRIQPLFYLPASRSLAYAYSPLLRLMHFFNTHCNNIDLFIVSPIVFKTFLRNLSVYC